MEYGPPAYLLLDLNDHPSIGDEHIGECQTLRGIPRFMSSTTTDSDTKMETPQHRDVCPAMIDSILPVRSCGERGNSGNSQSSSIE